MSYQELQSWGCYTVELIFFRILGQMGCNPPLCALVKNTYFAFAQSKIEYGKWLVEELHKPILLTNKLIIIKIVSWSSFLKIQHNTFEENVYDGDFFSLWNFSLSYYIKIRDTLYDDFVIPNNMSVFLYKLFWNNWKMIHVVRFQFHD